MRGAFVAKLSTATPRFSQDGVPLVGVASTFDTKVFANNTWGLVWKESGCAPRGQFPQYYKHQDGKRVAVAVNDVPPSTGLVQAEFANAQPGEAFTSPISGAWSRPQSAEKVYTVVLGDGSQVSYVWFRFVDQPSFQQYNFSEQKKLELQALVEKIHRFWPITRDYMAPPTSGELVTLDAGLIVEPPPGYEVGYVPVVVRQEVAIID